VLRRLALTLVTAALLFGTAAVALRVPTGLQAEFFDTIARTDAPSFTRVDDEISTARVIEDWLDSPPDVFSIRWTGYLTVSSDADYTFELTSDDGSVLTIDGIVAIDNGGQHGDVTRRARTHLEHGPHTIVLEYFQNGGPYRIDLAWGRGRGSLEPIPAWRLTTGRRSHWRVASAHAFHQLALFFSALALLTVALLGLTVWRENTIALVRRYPAAAALPLFIALTIAQTWPLASDPGHLSRNDNGDAVLNEWTMAWVAHQAPRDPLHLFDANIFYPETRTLAYSESLITQSIFAAPILWLGGSAVLAYSLVLISGFALNGWTMSLVVQRWTGDWIAGLLSGILFAFNAHTLTRLPHMQAQHVEFFPLALFSLDKLLREPRVRHAIWLAIWFALQALTSVYLLVLTAVALTVAVLCRPEDWLGRKFVRLAPYLLGAAALGGIIVLPFLLPYWHVSRDHGFTRTVEEAFAFSATWRDYLSTPGRLHYRWWSHTYFSGTPLFPGVLGVLLAIVAIVTGVAFRDRRARMCLAFGVAGVVLSFGGAVPGYALLYKFVPLFQGVRIVARFGYLQIIGIAVLAGFAFALVRRQMTNANMRIAVSGAALAIAFVEPLAAPIELTRFPGISPIYDRVAGTHGTIVVEIPFYRWGRSFAGATYQLNSTHHWRPLLNGYSGFQPDVYAANHEALYAFPDATSIAALQRQGVTHVFVHVNEMSPESVAKLRDVPSLHRVASDGTTVLFTLDR